MKIKLVIFDLDGTIANSIPLIEEIVSELLGRDVGIKRLKKEGIVDSLKGLNVFPLKLPFFILRIQNRIYIRLNEIEVFPGIEKTLEELKKQGYALGLITNNKKKTAVKFLKNNNLSKFDFVESNFFLFDKGKKIKKIIKRNNLNPEEVLYIGDQVSDIISSKRAGVKIMGVSWGFNSREELSEKNPDLIAENPNQILSLIKNSNLKK